MFKHNGKIERNGKKIRVQCPSESQGHCSISNQKKHESNRGQTLIETLVAIFILAMGVTISIGLATYAYKIADDSTKSVVATGLAREGIEAVKNLRDQEWLQNTPGTCNFPNGGQENCVGNWYGFVPNQNGSGNYALILNPPTQYTLQQNPASYALNFCAQPSNGIYFSATETLSCTQTSSTVYSRMIQITPIASTVNPAVNYQFTDSGGIQRDGLIDVTSTVWWSSRTCPATNDPTTLSGSCKVVLEMHLTNWQNQ